MPAPFVFGVVAAVTAALIIFFGAWAVSASAEGRELTFGFAGGAAGPGTANSEGGEQPQAVFGAAPIGETSGASDTWWGRGFLKACPLH